MKSKEKSEGEADIKCPYLNGLSFIMMSLQRDKPRAKSIIEERKEKKKGEASQDNPQGLEGDRLRKEVCQRGLKGT